MPNVVYGKRRPNFSNFTAKERFNFPAGDQYHVDIITLYDFLTGKLNADYW